MRLARLHRRGGPAAARLLGVLLAGAVLTGCGFDPTARFFPSEEEQRAKVAEARAELAAPPAQLPTLASLPCFECHDLEAYREGPPFPHASDEHAEIGTHCHVCHQSMGHQGMVIDRTPCSDCHDPAEFDQPEAELDQPEAEPR